MGSQLTLLGRSYCHLCEDMANALAPIAEIFGASVDMVDVDTDDALEARYGDLVPVLLAEDVELCHYFLDEAKVREYLSGIR